jgi:DNA-binding MarR family transcriptional regulator
LPGADGMPGLSHSPELALFAERDAGMIILLRLMLAGEADDAFAPTRPVPVSISALGAKFGVSRKHVLTLLRDAEAEGFVQRTGERNDRLTLLPRVHDAAQTMFASIFLFLAHCTHEALAVIGPRSAVA